MTRQHDHEPMDRMAINCQEPKSLCFPGVSMFLASNSPGSSFKAVGRAPGGTPGICDAREKQRKQSRLGGLDGTRGSLEEFAVVQQHREENGDMLYHCLPYMRWI